MKDYRYGINKLTLEQVIANEGHPFKAYGTNAFAIMDVLAHLKSSLETIESHRRMISEETEFPPHVLRSLSTSTPEIYGWVESLIMHAAWRQSDMERAERSTNTLANALTDINNILGEDPYIKLKFAEVEKLVTEYKG